MSNTFWTLGTRVAQEWLEVAMHNGPHQATEGVMYENGDGVPHDFVVAHMWYNIASANGFADAPEARDFVARR